MDLIPGGKADNKTDSAFSALQLHMGQKVEREHTNKPRLAREIARDHLTEIPDYYSRLKKMEDAAPKKDAKVAAIASDLQTLALMGLVGGATTLAVSPLLRKKRLHDDLVQDTLTERDIVAPEHLEAYDKTAGLLQSAGRVVASSTDDVVLAYLAHRRHEKGEQKLRMHPPQEGSGAHYRRQAFMNMKTAAKRISKKKVERVFDTTRLGVLSGGLLSSFGRLAMAPRLLKDLTGSKGTEVDVKTTIEKHLKAHGKSLDDYGVVTDSPHIQHPNAAYMPNWGRKLLGLKDNKKGGHFLFGGPRHQEYVIAHEVGHAQPGVLRKGLAPLRFLAAGPLGYATRYGGLGLIYSGLKDTARTGKDSNKTKGGIALGITPGAALVAEEGRANWHAAKSLKAVGSAVPRGLIARQMAAYALPMLGLPIAATLGALYAQNKFKALYHKKKR